MEDLNKKIKSFIKLYGRKIRLNFILDKLLFGILISLMSSLIILIVSIFITLKYSYTLIFSLSVLIILGSFIYSIIKLPKEKEIALIIDSKGLHERVITSLELKDNNSELAIVQKEDTLNKLRKFNYKKYFRLKVDKKKLYKVLVLILMCVITFFIPSASKTQARELRKFDEGKNEIINKVEKEKKDIEKNNELSEEEKKKLQEILEQAKKELKDLDNNKDINKLLERLGMKLDNLKNEANSEEGKKLIESLKKSLLEESMSKMKERAQKDLNTLNEKLNKSEKGKEISEALNAGNKEALENKLNDINNSLSSMSENEKIELSNALQEAAENLSDEDLQQLLQQASEGVMNGEIDASELANALASLSNSSQENNNSNSSAGKGSGSGTGSGNSSGSGSGSGLGSGSGSGSGSGAGGAGWNTGSKVGKENTDTPTSGEEIYIPGREVGNDGNLSGNKNSTGNSQSVETQNGLNLSGEKKNYNEVIDDYSQKELDSLDNSTLPQNMKDIIKDYFDGLN